MEKIDKLQKELGVFGWYQVRVLLATQLTLTTVSGSLLCTVFDSIIPSEYNCSDGSEMQNNGSSYPGTIASDFHSLIMELNLVCAHTYIPTLFSTAVMSGGASGAGVCGFLADRVGRRPVVLGTVAGCISINLAIAFFGSYHWILNLLFLFALGFAAGGYMVTNLVSLLETIGDQFWRLSATCLNGFPLALMMTGLFGFLAGTWRWYHLLVAGSGCPCFLALFFLLDESPRWLAQNNCMEESVRIFHKMSRTNGRRITIQKLTETLESLGVDQTSPRSSYTYRDLFRYRQIWAFLVPLCYSWFASSVILYGLYFNLGELAGNRFLNLILTGLVKGLGGLTPLLVSKWVGRKPVLMVSVCLTCISSWAAVFVYFFSENGRTSIYMTVFSVLGVAAIDPIWKVNHFYSAELFPTVVRNMARAVCNIGSRVGSVLAPQVSFLANFHFSLPYVIMGILSVFHVLVCAICLPETKGRVIPESLEIDSSSNALEGEIDYCFQLTELKNQRKLDGNDVN